MELIIAAIIASVVMLSPGLSKLWNYVFHSKSKENEINISSANGDRIMIKAKKNVKFQKSIEDLIHTLDRIEKIPTSKKR